jgi:hypothetical protein
MEVLVTGTVPGIVKEQIPCYIEFVENPIYLIVEANIKVRKKFKKILLIV